jgi:hypothetical protein
MTKMSDVTPVTLTPVTREDALSLRPSRVNTAEFASLVNFVARQVSQKGLQINSALIIAQSLYFKCKRLSASPKLTWPERKSIVTGLVNWAAKKYLSVSDYEALQPTLYLIIPDTLESLRDMARSKGGNLCSCLFGEDRPSKYSIEEDMDNRLKIM